MERIMEIPLRTTDTEKRSIPIRKMPGKYFGDRSRVILHVIIFYEAIYD